MSNPGPLTFTEAREALAEAMRIATIVEAFVVLGIFGSIMFICAVVS